MDKRSNLKKAIIILIIINIIYLVLFNGQLIRQTWLVKDNGSTYYLTQTLHNYKLCKINNSIIPIEISTELINSPDYINSLKEKSIDISLVYRIIEIIQVVIIIVVVVNFKTTEKS